MKKPRSKVGCVQPTGHKPQTSPKFTISVSSLSLICFSNLSIPKMKRRAYAPFQDIMGQISILKKVIQKSCIER